MELEVKDEWSTPDSQALEVREAPEDAGRRKEVMGPVSERIQKRSELRQDFGFLGSLSILYGIAASVCLYRNPLGITVPLFVAVSYGAMFLVLGRLKMKVKKGSLFLAAVSFLIGLSVCFTANMTVGYYMNRLALWLLFCIFILHQFHRDSKWNIGKYAVSLVVYLAEALGMIYFPFTHLAGYVKSTKSTKYKTALRLIVGVCAAVPAMIFLCLLLASADMVFQDMLGTILVKCLDPVSLFLVPLQTVAWAVILYSLVCSARLGTIQDDVADRQVHSPVAAISFMSMIALVYLAFCSVQVVYLFMGQGSLPWGMTYSDYARQGFFQLLFVAVLNLVMVLLCLKYCRENVILKAVLLVISLCTYIMIASAVYRMALYVQQYNLTFLRILVLWFLAMLSVLMAGVVIVIVKRTFPLFRFCLAVISIFYLGFAWMKPDYVAAKYNVGHIAELGWENVQYLGSLSWDAAPAVMELSDVEVRNKIFKSYASGMDYRIYKRSVGIRDFNFSAWRARKLWRVCEGD